MKWLAPLAVVVALCGCGGASASGAAAGCQGLPTAQGADHFLALFGTVSDLDRAKVCAQVGAPKSVSRDAKGHVVWHYAGGTLTFDRGRVIEGSRLGGQFEVGYLSVPTRTAPPGAVKKLK